MYSWHINVFFGTCRCRSVELNYLHCALFGKWYYNWDFWLSDLKSNLMMLGISFLLITKPTSLWLSFSGHFQLNKWPDFNVVACCPLRLISEIPATSHLIRFSFSSTSYSWLSLESVLALTVPIALAVLVGRLLIARDLWPLLPRRVGECGEDITKDKEGFWRD